MERLKIINGLLKANGVRQMDIARMLKVAPASVHDSITGKRKNPRIRQAIALATGKKKEELWPDE